MPAAVVVCMDVSDSMRSSGYFETARSDASLFVNNMNVGDSAGVTAFSDNSWIAYPGPSSLVGLLQSQADRTAASNAVMSLSTQSMTNMSAGLSTSAGMLSSAAAPKAIVMLSDGMWNRGTDPTQNLPAVRVFTIALGGNLADRWVQVLIKIASLTGATFHLAPSLFDLQDIYNEIIGQTQVAAVVANGKQTLAQNNFWILPGSVLPGVSEATFSVSWTDWGVTYTPGTPVGNQVSVQMRDPGGNTLTPAPSGAGNGFAVFRVPNPQAGKWQIGIWSSAAATLGTSGGMFDPLLSLQLNAEAPMDAIVGQPVVIRAQVRDRDGSPVPDAVIWASLEMPSMDPEEAVNKHRARLDALEFSQVPEEVSDNTRMLALQAQVGPGERLLPYHHIPLSSEKGDQGARHVEFTPKNKGGHIVWLTATGRDPKTKGEFSLTRRISVWSTR
jgi:hypothetical protein